MQVRFLNKHLKRTLANGNSAQYKLEYILIYIFIVYCIHVYMYTCIYVYCIFKPKMILQKTMRHEVFLILIKKVQIEFRSEFYRCFISKKSCPFFISSIKVDNISIGHTVSMN